MSDPIKVLDYGFVSLVDHMGSDLSAVNAARVSFGKRKDSFDAGDAKLVSYLATHEHTTPFRHAYVTLHLKCPIFVARQWMKHQVGCSWNEISGRYVEFDPEFYIPEQFRSQAVNVKQGSGEDLDTLPNANAKMEYALCCGEAFMRYKTLLAMGVAKEQARGILPLALYTEAYWTASLQAVAHFLHLREDSHAQWEMQQYAHAVRQLVEPLFPYSLEALLRGE